MSSSLDPEQARHFVGPDLGPDCLQMLSAEDKRPLGGMDTLFREVTLPKWFCFFSEKVSFLKGKNLLWCGENSFLFSEGI